MEEQRPRSPTMDKTTEKGEEEEQVTISSPSPFVYTFLSG